MVAHRNAVVTEDVDLFHGFLAATDDVLGLEDLLDPSFLHGAVQVFLDLGIFEILGIGIDRIDGGIALLVRAVLLEAVEAAGGLLGRFRHGFLEVAAGRGNRPDEGDGSGLPVVEDDHAGAGVEVRDDRREVDRESVGAREFLHTVGHLAEGLGPAGGRVGEEEAFQAHRPVVFADRHGRVDRGFTGGDRHVGSIADDGRPFHQVASGVRVDQFREFGEDLHDLVRPFAAGGHDDDVGVALLGDGVLEDGLSATERTRDEPGAAFGDRIEGIDDADARLHDPGRTGFLAVALDRNLDGPFLDHRDRDLFSVGVDEDRYRRIDGVGPGCDDGFDGVFALEVLKKVY